MLNISKRIDIIESLLSKETDESMVYGALEARLTIEYICYERLKLSYPYLSHDDLKNWQPKKVVEQISKEINEDIVKEFKLSISKEPINTSSPISKAQLESQEYTEIGKQSELKITKLHKFWNAFSNLALHISTPKEKEETMSLYGDKEKIKAKLSSFIDLLKELDKGNMITGGTKEATYTFDCLTCDMKISRPISYLNEPKIVNCINPNCIESYDIKPENNIDFEITRRTINYECTNCSNTLCIPINIFNNLRFNQKIKVICEKCSSEKTIIMRPLIKKTS